jgi:hypothetical protein
VSWSVWGKLLKFYIIIDNRMLCRILGPKREELANDWRRLHNEELPYF